MTKRVQLTLLLVLLCAAVAAQEDSTRLHWNLRTGATVASGFGRTESIGWLSPTVRYRANDRLTVRGGLATAASLLPDGYRPQGLEGRSLAPRRQGTRAGMVWAAAEYKASDRLWLWASVAHLRGFAQPLWLDHSLPLEATAVSGGVAYDLGQAGLLEMHFHFVHDHYGTTLLGPMAHPYYGRFAPGWEAMW